MDLHFGTIEVVNRHTDEVIIELDAIEAYPIMARTTRWDETADINAVRKLNYLDVLFLLAEHKIDIASDIPVFFRLK